jgi:hypothetical protein
MPIEIFLFSNHPRQTGQMKTKCTSHLEITLTEAVSVPKPNKSTKAERVSKSKSTTKASQKATHIKPVPAKGLELDDDDDDDEEEEDESDLENEFEEENALNELVEKSHDPQVNTEEEVRLPNIPIQN